MEQQQTARPVSPKPGKSSSSSVDSIRIPSSPTVSSDASAPRSRASSAADNLLGSSGSHDDSQQQQQPHTIPSEDEEIRLAHAMAIAIENNPNLTPAQAQELVLKTTGVAPATSSSATAPSILPGRLTDMFQQTALEAERTASTLRERAKGMFATTGGATATTASSTSAAETAVAAVTEQDHRAVFRKSNAPSIRSPPLSPIQNQNSTVAAAEGLTIAPSMSLTNSMGQPVGLPSAIASSVSSPSPSQMEPIRISGIAWKRRGGMGKYSSLAWERRRIELRGTKLLYYRNDEEDHSNNQPMDDSQRTAHSQPDEEGVLVAKRSQNWIETGKALINQNLMGHSGSPGDPTTTPRGYMDLYKEKATVHAAFGHSGAPSPFAISIKARGETKWKLCFDYHKTQMEWMTALTDVVVQASVDSYNSHLLSVADPTSTALADSIFQQPPQVNQPPSGSKGQEASVSKRLWMLDSYQVSSTLDGFRPVDLDDETEEYDDDDGDYDEDMTEIMTPSKKPRALLSRSNKQAQSTPQMPTVNEAYVKAHVVPSWCIPQTNGVRLLLCLNVGLVASRATTVQGFWYVLLLTHAAVYCCASLEPDWKELVKHLQLIQTKVSNNAAAAKKVGDKKRSGTARKSNAAGGDPASTKGSTVAEDYKPTAGCSTIRLKETTDLPVNSKDEVFAGWRNIGPDVLAVRSHGYSSTKAKIPSPGSLYECSKVDIFESANRYPDMAPRVVLPKLDYKDDGQTKTWRCPDVFIVSIALPTDPPKLGRSSSDGGGYTVTCYFTMRQETRDILRRVTAEGYEPSSEIIDDPQQSRVNAVRLLEEWVRRAPNDPKWFARFKVVPNAHNLKEIGMPSWISKYNGKPFLIKRPGTTGFIFEHPELSCMEFDISLHPFPYLAKQAICFMKESFFKKILVTFGFVIEGKTDDELPECILGNVQLCYPDPAHAIQGDDFFDGSAKKSTD